MSDCRKANNRPQDKIRELQRSLYRIAKQDSERKFHALHDKVYRRDTLVSAWAQVASNGGAAGVDRETIEHIKATNAIHEIISDLQEQLKKGTYRFSPVRRVEIPKAKGGTRPLGIATVRDRIVQTAMKIVMEPIFEAGFHDCSYGYRPKRNARMASEAIREDLFRGWTWAVVEVDLKSYFTSIPHGKLMTLIRKRVADGKMLKLIKDTLKVAVSNDGSLERTRVGVPQGSPLSPLYSNIYLNVLDQAWHKLGYPEKLGATMHRYADDMVLICRQSTTLAQQALEEILSRMDLELNQEKTKTTRIKDGFDFIGYEFVRRKSKRLGKSRNYIFPSRASQVNRVTRGWAEYYRHTNGVYVMRKMQWFICNRVRRYLSYRCKRRGWGFDKYPNEELLRMGLIDIRRACSC